MKQTKRTLAVLLALVMLLCGVPLAAQGSSVVDSGTDGNISWTLDIEGTLTISGTGAMNNYIEINDNGTFRTSAPWGQYYQSIQTVVVESGVTSVGSYAFRGCTALQSVSIGDGVESIGDWAFLDCTALQAFQVHENNAAYASDRDGCLFNKDRTILVQYPTGNTRTEYTIPDHVTEIDEGAFAHCAALEHVTIPDGVTSIHRGAFAYCAALESVTVPDGVTSIDRGVFAYCAALESVTIGNSVTSIGDEAFAECTALQNVYYTGSEAEWNAISIGNDNEPLTTATKHYNYQHEHRSGVPVRENEVGATCTEPLRFDEVTYCAICGEERSREAKTSGDPLGHDGQTYGQQASCAGGGYSITICRRCGETLASDVFPALEHTWNDGKVTAEATCTAQGMVTYTCTACGAAKTEPTDLLNHDWDDGEMTKEPTCTAAGEMTYTCLVGGEIRTEPIEKRDHRLVLVPGKAAACEDAGLTDGWQCETCKTWFAEQQTINPFDHDYEPVYTWADDNSTVTATLVCTRCNATSATETVAPDVRITQKPTCTKEGERTYAASFNSKAFYPQSKTEPIEKLPHQTALIRQVSPTCTSEGVVSHWRCGTCGGIFTDEAATVQLKEPPKIERRPHTFYEVPAVEPTCTEDGVVGYWRCETCETCFADAAGTPAMFPLPAITATGHTAVTDKAVEPTCTEDGLTEGSHCGVCKKVLTAQKPVAALGHKDKDNNGKCDTCGKQMTGPDACPQCGKIHNGGVFDRITGFFHRIVYRLTHLFG